MTDVIGSPGALPMRPGGRFISDSDCLIDGGVTAAVLFGDLGSA